MDLSGLLGARAEWWLAGRERDPFAGGLRAGQQADERPINSTGGRCRRRRCNRRVELADCDRVADYSRLAAFCADEYQRAYAQPNHAATGHDDPAPFHNAGLTTHCAADDHPQSDGHSGRGSDRYRNDSGDPGLSGRDPATHAERHSIRDIAVMSPEVVANVRAIYAHGQTLGRDPRAFSKLGDSLVLTDHYLTRFDSRRLQPRTRSPRSSRRRSSSPDHSAAMAWPPGSGLYADFATRPAWPMRPGVRPKSI